jgi:hypothetical protein
LEAKGPALLKKARLVDVLTFLAVILVTPASVIFLIPFGVSPQDWFSTWQRYVALFILLAMGLAVFGFAVSTDYKLEADRLGRKNP